jgi:hypothetical protein
VITVIEALRTIKAAMSTLSLQSAK